MKVELEDLVDQTMIAGKLRTTNRAVNNWTSRFDDFPDPIARFGNVPVYLWSDVEEWVVHQFGRKRLNEGDKTCR